MKLGLGLYGNMLTADNFKFARQAGATHIVAHVVGHFQKPGAKDIITDGSADYGFGLSRPDESAWTLEWMRDLRARAGAEGLQLEAIENFEPAHWADVLLDGPRRDEQMAHLKRIIRDVGRAGIPVFGYNFSVAGVWGRDQRPAARGGAVSVGYHARPEPPIPKGMVWNMVYDTDAYDPLGRRGVIEPFSHEELWRRFERFLRELLPVAEQSGVKLALHPDDPPLPTLRGTPRLVYRWDLYQRVLDVAPSPNNCLEFCVGTLAEMSERQGFGDIYDMVGRYASTGRIGYVHFRNVVGQVPNYDEVFVDEGDVDMIGVLRALKDGGYDGVLIPDHTPAMACAAPWHAGMAYALGFMRAALKSL